MEVREITNKEEWEGFLQKCSEKTFLQSWNWGEFSARGASASGGNWGGMAWRFGVYENERLISACLVLKISARRGTFLFAPHGPAIESALAIIDKKEILSALLNHLKQLAKEEGACFIRISPIMDRTPENNLIFKELGFRDSPIHMHPEVTWELSVGLDEEQLLGNMRKTTRYLIRQAEKNPDIEIVKSENLEDLELFFPVYKETAKRHHFVVFSQKYLEAQFKCFAPDGQIMIFLGKYKGEVVSAAIFVFWQKMCFYHHSGSLSKYNKIPVSYLLQWEAIKEAKKRNCLTYNFWGIAPDIKADTDAKKSRHPWAGLSLFKMGFGGFRKDFVKTQDFIISKKYWINYIIEAIRKRKRNL